jgi:hypothetical protein
MKWFGYRQIALKSIIVDAPDIRAREKAAHVAELASDIRTRGEEPIHAPTVRAGSNTLLCGRDRFAALRTLKAKKLWVHVVDCDETEARELELAENIYRRADNRSELIAQLVSLKEQQLKSAEQAGMTRRAGVTVSQLAPQTIKAQARREVARAAGVTTAAVRQAEVRSARAKGVARDGHGAAGEPLTGDQLLPHETPVPGGNLERPCIDLLGTPREHAEADGLLEECSAIQAAIDEADKYMRLALAATKPLETTLFTNGEQQEIRREIQRVGSLVRSKRPGSICPWCKGLAQQIPECGGCRNDRWVSAERAATAPVECVMHTYADVAAGKVKQVAANPATRRERRISVEVDGRVYQGDGDELRELTVEREDGR